MYLEVVGNSSAPSTSRTFQPTTDIALNTQDIIRLCNCVLANQMKNTHNPDITMLLAVNRNNTSNIYSTLIYSYYVANKEQFAVLTKDTNLVGL
jgi:hypothetical protein